MWCSGVCTLLTPTLKTSFQGCVAFRASEGFELLEQRLLHLNQVPSCGRNVRLPLPGSLGLDKSLLVLPIYHLSSAPNVFHGLFGSGFLSAEHRLKLSSNEFTGQPFFFHRWPMPFTNSSRFHQRSRPWQGEKRWLPPTASSRPAPIQPSTVSTSFFKLGSRGQLRRSLDRLLVFFFKLGRATPSEPQGEAPSRMQHFPTWHHAPHC